MGRKRYNEPKEKVPVPDDARVYRNGRVVLVDTSLRGGKDPVKTVIGHVCVGETDESGRRLMFPNENYEECCKDDGANAGSGPDGQTSKSPPRVIHVGLTSLVLGIVYQLGIYQMLISVYNEQIANAIIDLAMFYILACLSNNSISLPQMSDQLLFSIESHDDSWYDELFQGKNQGRSVNDASNREFMARWARHVKNVLCEKDDAEFGTAVLSLDGTNWNDQLETSTEAQPGQGKTGEKGQIAGSMFCVVANGIYKGMPLAYCPTIDFNPNLKTFQEKLSLFHGMDLYPEVMIADSTFCTEDFMAACDSLSLPFLIMMQEDDTGAQTMYKLHRDLLRWNFDHRILGHGLTFGISENGHSVFGPNSKNPDRTAHFAVFYNATQAFSLTKDFIDNLDQKMDALKEDIESFAAKERGRARTSGSTNAIESSTDILSRDAFIQQARKKLDAAGVRVPEGYESYLSIEYNFEEGKYNIVENSAAIRKTCNSYGYDLGVKRVPPATIPAVSAIKRWR